MGLLEFMPTALVSGCSSGIGRAVCISLAKTYGRDLHLVMVARRADRLKELREEVANLNANCDLVVEDIVDYNSLNSKISSLGLKFDWVINCAGCMYYQSFVENCDMNLLYQEIDVNCKGLINLFQIG